MELASVIKVNNISGVRLCGPNVSIVSKKLALTNHHMLFVSEIEDFSVLHRSIDEIRLLNSVAERRYPGSGMAGYTLMFRTKLFCIYELTVATLHEARGLLQSLEALSNIDRLDLCYPFVFKPDFPCSLDSIRDNTNDLTNARWKQSGVNKDFTVCLTYPEEVLIPVGLSNATVVSCAAFRRGGRFPLVVYVHQARKTALLIASEPLNTATSSSVTGVAATVNPVQTSLTATSGGLRSVQSVITRARGSPMHHNANVSSTGPMNASNGPNPSTLSTSGGSTFRCREDEQFLAAVLPDGYRGMILDLREQMQIPKKPVVSGGSNDSELYYTQWRRVYRPLKSVNTLNVKFRKFIEVCTAPGCGAVKSSAMMAFGAKNTSALADSLGLPTSALVTSTTTNLSYTVDTPRLSYPTDDDSNNAPATPERGNSDMSTVAGSSQVAFKTRRVAAWLTLVRETLAAAVAGATALDARDASAMQQLQQEQCLLDRKFKEAQIQASRSMTIKAGMDHSARPIREEAKLRGSFVLIQSSNGTDRALVVAGLIQVILNPSARTFIGFQTLIETTWIQAGHQFSERCRNSFSPLTRSATNVAPMFILFLDAVWQLWRQYPTSFEFTDNFLCLIAQHAYYSEFGTFLGNSMKERKECNLESRTTSLWKYISQPAVRMQYTNPFFQHSSTPSDRENYACWPCLASQALEVWRELYLKQQILDPDSLWSTPRHLAQRIVEKFDAECEQVRSLQCLVESLQQEAISAGLLVNACST